ncbi:D-xylose transport system permease protein [Frankineae bacterium MT45]|nr:D-xylose transport system permease protein [Frankineae bacterium MT45]
MTDSEKDLLTSGSTNATAATPPTVAASDFANDVGAKNIGEAFRNYQQKVRGGDVGALPAVVGVLVLVAIFYTANNLFLSKANFANFLTQAAPYAILAMGTIFVLLLGEIDLSIGTASGVAAVTMALALNHKGDLNAALGTTTYVVFLAFFVLAAGIATFYRLWIPLAIILAGIICIVTKLDQYQLLAMFVAIAVGVSIGTTIGFLVAHIGIPSFIVTLALFLAFQGVLLKFIGASNAIPTRQFNLVNNIENGNMTIGLSWTLWAISMALYAAFTIGRSVSKRRAKLTGEPLDLVILRAVLITVTTGLAVYVLNQNRARSVFATLEGVPWVIPIVAVVFVLWTLVTTKTRYGRYIYATGGNTEAARRAGIDVRRIRLSVFIIASGMAGLAGIIGASKQGGVPSDFGAHTDQLYAVGAAVIGGTSLFGGRGKIRDGIIGALVIAMIPNGLGLKGLGPEYEYMITGGFLLLAASVDALSRRRATAAR